MTVTRSSRTLSSTSICPPPSATSTSPPLPFYHGITPSTYSNPHEERMDYDTIATGSGVNSAGQHRESSSNRKRRRSDEINSPDNYDNNESV